MEEKKGSQTVNVLELHREKYERRLRIHRWLKGLSVSDMLMLANTPKDAKRRKVSTSK